MAAGVWVLMQHHDPAFLSWDTQKWVLKVNPSKTFPSHHISRGLNDAFRGSNVSQTFAGFSPFFYHSLRTHSLPNRSSTWSTGRLLGCQHSGLRGRGHFPSSGTGGMQRGGADGGCPASQAPRHTVTPQPVCKATYGTRHDAG